MLADLFTRGIALSGTAIADWAFEVNPLKMFRQQIQYSGLSKAVTENNRMAVRELRRLDAKKLFTDSLQFSKDFDRIAIFKPTIEPRVATAFLTDNPKTIWKSGGYKQRPLLLSFVPIEGGWFSKLLKSEKALMKANENVDQFLGNALEMKPENIKRAKDNYLSGLENRLTAPDLKPLLQVL